MVVDLNNQLERAKISYEDLEHQMDVVVAEHERGRAELEEQLQLAMSKEERVDY